MRSREGVTGRKVPGLPLYDNEIASVALLLWNDTGYQDLIRKFYGIRDGTWDYFLI